MVEFEPTSLAFFCETACLEGYFTRHRMSRTISSQTPKYVSNSKNLFQDAYCVPNETSFCLCCSPTRLSRQFLPVSRDNVPRRSLLQTRNCDNNACTDLDCDDGDIDQNPGESETTIISRPMRSPMPRMVSTTSGCVCTTFANISSTTPAIRR